MNHLLLPLKESGTHSCTRPDTWTVIIHCSAHWQDVQIAYNDFLHLHLHTYQAQMFPFTDGMLQAISFQQQMHAHAHTHTLHKEHRSKQKQTQTQNTPLETAHIKTVVHREGHLSFYKLNDPLLPLLKVWRETDSQVVESYHSQSTQEDTSLSTWNTSYLCTSAFRQVKSLFSKKVGWAHCNTDRGKN